MDAILARHANLGAAPTDLHENKAESRGSFTIRMIRTGLDEDGEVALAIWGPNHPFKCTMRGYRKLSDDFQGNSVYTGFQQKWTGVRRIDTGYISPGVDRLKQFWAILYRVFWVAQLTCTHPAAGSNSQSFGRLQSSPECFLYSRFTFIVCLLACLCVFVCDTVTCRDQKMYNLNLAMMLTCCIAVRRSGGIRHSHVP